MGSVHAAVTILVLTIATMAGVLGNAQNSRKFEQSTDKIAQTLCEGVANAPGSAKAAAAFTSPKPLSALERTGASEAEAVVSSFLVEASDPVRRDLAFARLGDDARGIAKTSAGLPASLAVDPATVVALATRDVRGEKANTVSVSAKFANGFHETFIVQRRPGAEWKIEIIVPHFCNEQAKQNLKDGLRY